MFGFLLVLMMTACQTTTDGSVTVEVTRLINEQVFATVAVPVEVTREVVVEVTPTGPTLDSIVMPLAAPIGSADNKLRLVISPLSSPQATALRGQALIDALAAETGLAWEVVAPTTHAETTAAVCSDRDRTVAILTSLEYVVANRLCDLQHGYSALRNGIPWVGSMVVTLTPESAEDRLDSLADFAGKSWGVSSTADLTNYLYFKALFQSEGVETGPVTEYGTDASTIIAGFDGNEDFVTATFIPPLLPYNERLWEYGEDDPELWYATGNAPRRSGIGYVVVYDYVERGGYHVRDARANVIDTRPTIFAYTELAMLSDQMPNDAVAFGDLLPIKLTRQIGAALEKHTASDGCDATLCSSDFFAWEGIVAVEDDFYSPVRFVIDQLSLSDEQVYDSLDIGR